MEDFFLFRFVAKAKALAKSRKVGDPFTEVEQGPQVKSNLNLFLPPREIKCFPHFQVDNEQFKKILGLIESGKNEGATLQAGGDREGKVGYFVQPTVFSDVK